MEKLYRFFDSLTPIPMHEWKRIESKFNKFSFKKGEVIQKTGTIPTHFYIIEKGIAKASYIGADGREFIKTFFSENDIASTYVEVLKKIPSRVEIRALEDINGYSFPFLRVSELYLEHPCWNAIGRIIVEKFFIAKEQREYEFLMLDAKERYESFQKTLGHIESRIPDNQIALYLGISPVSLSRVKNKLKTNE